MGFSKKGALVAYILIPMILAASDERHEKVVFIAPEKDIVAGSKIR